jgi:sortase A
LAESLHGYATDEVNIEKREHQINKDAEKLIRDFVKWAQRFLLVVGIAALGFAGATLLQERIYQSYQTYALRQALRDRPASLTGFLTQWFNRPANELPTSAATAKTAPAKGSPHGNSSSNRENSTARPGSRVPAHPVEKGSPIGLLEIPRLRLSVVVLEGTDDRTLRLGAGHIEHTALPGEAGNLGIAGHRDTFFRALKDIRKDDAVQITTPEGRFEYRVQSTQILTPKDTWVLRPSSSASLTLVTCYPFYFVGPAPERFIVRATQTLVTPLASSSSPGNSHPAGAEPQGGRPVRSDPRGGPKPDRHG